MSMQSRLICIVIVKKESKNDLAESLKSLKQKRAKHFQNFPFENGFNNNHMSKYVLLKNL